MLLPCIVQFGSEEMDKFVLPDRGFGAHGHQCSNHFQNFEDLIISYFYVLKNYGVKYIDRYKQEKCMRKSPIKNMLYSGKY
jgi:hypothetical protein